MAFQLFDRARNYPKVSFTMSKLKHYGYKAYYRRENKHGYNYAIYSTSNAPFHSSEQYRGKD